MSHLQLTPDRPPEDSAADQRQDEPETDQRQDEPEILPAPPGLQPRDDEDDVRRAAADQLDRLEVARAADEGMTGATPEDAEHGPGDKEGGR